MVRSEQRILTTHAGSLPRPKPLVEMFANLSQRQVVDGAELRAAVEESTRRVIERQLAAGIDVGNDGEQPRESFFTYVQHRMSGFGGQSHRPIMRDIVEYPSFAELKFRDLSRTMVNLLAAPKAIAEVRYVDRSAIEQECAACLRILAAADRRFTEPFMTSASPGIIASAMLNEHYPSYGAYLMAVASALRVEYEYIVSQGFVLQIDCPDLAMERHTSYADRPLGEFLDYVDLNVSAINHALETIPRDRVRMHVCWGNYEGPHHRDVPLHDIIDILLAARPAGLSVEAANPRHAHEWSVFESVRLPEGKVVIPGVLDTTTHFIEHPELVAQRLVQYARLVGGDNVIAGVDCGFATFAGRPLVDSRIAWAKLGAMVEGARLASRRLGH
jgi:5-methyltetrahydropteroyltriglutamate--homocysteine methyltransferase